MSIDYCLKQSVAITMITESASGRAGQWMDNFWHLLNQRNPLVPNVVDDPPEWATAQGDDGWLGEPAA